jgi:Core-2/I-Branching enzyme
MDPCNEDSGSSTPSFAYLLLTHERPRQVEELGTRLLELSPSADIVVHHDLASPDLPWGGQTVGPIHFVPRGNVLWGDWSMVEATLRLLRFAVDNLSSDWFVLVSGDHRPVTDLQTWECKVIESRFDAYLPAEKLEGRLRFGPTHVESNLYMTRSRHRWASFSRPRSPLLHRGVGGLMKLSQWVQPIIAMEFAHRRDAWVIGWRRSTRALQGLRFYRGSQWIVLSRKAALKALTTEPLLTEWFQRSWIPDETFLQTVLRTSDLVVSDAPSTFVLETPDQPFTGWMQLTLEDLPAVWDSGTAFARKVDALSRPQVAAAIDGVVDQARFSEQIAARHEDHEEPPPR